MLCLALQPGQKSGMILPFKKVLKLKLPNNNNFNKKCAYVIYEWSLSNKVSNVGSDTFGNPIFQKVLQN